MERSEALRVDQTPLLGSGPVIGVHYVGVPPAASPADRDPRAPLAAPEVLARLDQIIVELQANTRATQLIAPRPDPILRGSLDLLSAAATTIACTQHDTAAVVADLHTELQALRADLAARTFASRMRRFGAWLKGLITWQ